MNLHTSVTSYSRSFKMYASRLEKLDIKTLKDFIFHLPSRYEDYSVISPIAQIQEGETVTIQGQVLEIKTNFLRGTRIKTMQKALVADGSGTIELTWFNQPFLTKTILPNTQISASGKVAVFGRSRKLSIQSPQYEILNTNTPAIHTARLIPVYPETQGISSKWLRRQIHTILTQYIDELEEYLPEKILRTYKLPDLQEAMKEIHYPRSIESANQARHRLAFDELLLMQLNTLQKRAEWNKAQNAVPFEIKKHMLKINKCIKSLPFTLTNAQKIALNEIFDDLQQTNPMNRLLQGDVGSGKTIVAGLAIFSAYLNGFQSTLMAPTEILAVQHFLSLQKLLEPLGVTVGLVTGSKKLKTTASPHHSGLDPESLPANLRHSGLDPESLPASNKIPKIPASSYDVLIGTHALLSDKITFTNLGLVIIDEQQRFGVEQRGIIKNKGNNPHFLTMTATPIPRTVALTMYGDLDISYLNEMPFGRKRIKTWLVPKEKRSNAYEWIRKQIQETNCQAFIVCPFIEPSETMQTIKAVKQEYEKLQKEIFPELTLGLLHGKQTAKEKELILQDFKNEKFPILVATPVVEVGIDIPNATIIVIEASERFGLAQLHQLRGRVGRNDKQSYCLLFSETTNNQTEFRLKSMERIFSGSDLAELDLKLRGSGDIFGTAQHGIPRLKAASFSDTDLIKQAGTVAKELFPDIERYPQLLKKLQDIGNENITPD